MVAPLFVLSLLWERFDWRSSRLLRPRSLTWRLGPLRRTITGTALASGILLALMGGATLYLGLAGDAMPTGSGWQADVSAELQHYGKVVTDALGWVPGWAGAVVVVAIVALLARRAFNELLGPDDHADSSSDGPADGAEPAVSASDATDATPEHQYV